MKLRLIQLEYDYKDDFNVSTEQELEEVKKKFEVDVRRIYSEETQQALPNLTKYKSNGTSVFNRTAEDFLIKLNRLLWEG